MLKVYQKAFLRTAIAVEALQFGQFTLKSGRISPYFFNAGAFCHGEALATLATAYAATIVARQEAGLKIDLLFGPAYKGIPLVAAVATQLFQQYQCSLPWTFNRKEAKDHGEGGILVGADVADKNVLIVDDVLTAGTAIRESLALLRAHKAHPVAVVVALDRQEVAGDSGQSALALLAQNEHLHTDAVVTLNDLMQFVNADKKLQPHFAAMCAYREQYGAGS